MSDLTGKIDDGGERISYGDGMAVREPSTGKGRYDLVSPFATRRLANGTSLVLANMPTETGKKGFRSQDMLTQQKDTWTNLLWVWKMKTIWRRLLGTSLPLCIIKNLVN